MKTVLTIAGSDCSGGAGIEADLKTMTAHGVYGMSVITALTAQNTTGVYGIAETAPEFVARQLDCVFSDIRPDAVKIGMTASAETICVIADRLIAHHAKNIVLDPVMVSTSGRRLLPEAAVRAMVERLFPLATLLTPNVPEAEVLCGKTIHTAGDLPAAARAIRSGLSCGVLLKGGHLRGNAADYLSTTEGGVWLCAGRLHTPHTHGTGCTLSTAIACNLALEKSIQESVSAAKQYLTAAIRTAPRLGHGNGPLNHLPPRH